VPAAGQAAPNSAGTAKACGPDTRITAIAERPGGVANAKIVSLLLVTSRIVITSRLIGFTLDLISKLLKIHSKC
jgi:hypothetical protein